MDPRVVLDWCKSLAPRRVLIVGPSTPKRVAIPTELSRPISIKGKGKGNPRTNSALDEGEFSTPPPGRFASGKREGYHFTGVWVGLRVVLDWRKSLAPHRVSILGPSTP